MWKNNIKEKLILLGGCIGIGLISLAITLTVYNVQYRNIDKTVEVPKSNVNKEIIVTYDDGLTDAQRVVAQNLIAKLDELQNEKENQIINKENSNKENEMTKVIDKTLGNVLTQTNELDDELIQVPDIELNDQVIETTAKIENKIQFIEPVDGKLGMIFSDERLVYSKTLGEWLTHKGVDILASPKSSVLAAADGTIKEMYDDEKYGFTILIEHDNEYISKYCGVDKTNLIKVGDKVKQGEEISKIAIPCGFEVSEGSHLHFEVLKNGINIEPEFI